MNQSAREILKSKIYEDYEEIFNKIDLDEVPDSPRSRIQPESGVYVYFSKGVPIGNDIKLDISDINVDFYIIRVLGKLYIVPENRIIRSDMYGWIKHDVLKSFGCNLDRLIHNDSTSPQKNEPNWFKSNDLMDVFELYGINPAKIHINKRGTGFLKHNGVNLIIRNNPKTTNSITSINILNVISRELCDAIIFVDEKDLTVSILKTNKEYRKIHSNVIGIYIDDIQKNKGNVSVLENLFNIHGSADINQETPENNQDSADINQETPENNQDSADINQETPENNQDSADKFKDSFEKVEAVCDLDRFIINAPYRINEFKFNDILRTNFVFNELICLYIPYIDQEDNKLEISNVRFSVNFKTPKLNIYIRITDNIKAYMFRLTKNEEKDLNKPKILISFDEKDLTKAYIVPFLNKSVIDFTKQNLNDCLNKYEYLEDALSKAFNHGVKMKRIFNDNDNYITLHAGVKSKFVQKNVKINFGNRIYTQPMNNYHTRKIDSLLNLDNVNKNTNENKFKNITIIFENGLYKIHLLDNLGKIVQTISMNSDEFTSLKHLLKNNF